MVENAEKIVATPEQKTPPAKNSKKIILKIITVVLGLTVIVLAVSGLVMFLNRSMIQKQNQASQNNQSQDSPKTVLDLPEASFARYQEFKSDIIPKLPDYSLKVDELTNLKHISLAARINFDNPKISALEQNGFFIQPTESKPTDSDTEIFLKGGDRVDDMIDLYIQFGGGLKKDRKPENAVFVSSDFLLHIYHVLIDRTFQKIEEEKLQPALKQLTQALFQKSLDNYNSISDPELKESLKRTTAFYLVPLTILDSSQPVQKEYFSSPEEGEKLLLNDQNVDSPDNLKKILFNYEEKSPREIFQLAKDELELVIKATGFGSSPIYGSLKPDWRDDYSQYKPRSHYTKNSVLRSYFRAMMWYGRHGFEVKSADLTRDALVMTGLLSNTTNQGKKAADLWEYIYLPSVFFVGRSDDLTFYDYAALITKIYGNNADLSALADQAKLTQFQTEAQKLEGPKILSEFKLISNTNPPTKEELLASTKGFRFMGQRFIPDSYMFSSLTQGDEAPDSETGQNLPSTPTALMVMSVLGSKTADTLLDEWVKTNEPRSDKVITKVINFLKSEFSKFDDKTWTQNIYWAWLYNLLPLFNEFGKGYPEFMKNLAWGKKNLISSLGSWTELRHDTLLYAKQSYAELGGAPPEGEIPPVPKGYVEPNLSFLTRLIALNKMTVEGLSSKDYLIPGQKEKFEGFANALEFFKTVAEKELSDSIISDDDYEKLRTIIKFQFPSIVWSLDADSMTEKDARMGIIADVHTDVPKNQILYEAIGTPSIIYVAVKDKNGARLTRGTVYSYYEFTLPVGSRLTDEQWQSWIYEGKDADKIPPIPSWTSELIIP